MFNFADAVCIKYKYENISHCEQKEFFLPCLRPILWWFSTHDIGQDAMDGDNSKADYHLSCTESVFLSELSETECQTGKGRRFHRKAANESVAAFGRIYPLIPKHRIFNS